MRSTVVLRLCSAAIWCMAAVAMVLPAQANAISGSYMLAIINQHRVSAGLGPLQLDSRLNASAYAKAQDLCAKDYWAHTSPSGVTPWHFMDNAGYPYTTAAENLAEGFSSEGSVVAAWMASPGHRANILSGSFQDFGAGFTSCNFQGRQTTVIVSHFGAKYVAQTQTRPAATKPTPKPAPSRTEAVMPVQTASRQSEAVQSSRAEEKVRGATKEVPKSTVAKPDRSSNKSNEMDDNPLLQLLLKQLHPKVYRLVVRP